MSESEKQQAMQRLHVFIGLRLVQIEDEVRRLGLKAITNYTLIARDPDNGNMCLLVTNEDQDGLRKATDVALGNATQAVVNRA